MVEELVTGQTASHRFNQQHEYQFRSSHHVSRNSWLLDVPSHAVLPMPRDFSTLVFIRFYEASTHPSVMHFTSDLEQGPHPLLAPPSGSGK